MGAPNLFLASGAIEPRYAPVWHASVLILSKCLTVVLRKTQGGEHCCRLVNLCSEEIVRGISCVRSENLDLLRIYISV